MSELIITEVKKLRVSIDGLSQLTRGLNPVEGEMYSDQVHGAAETLIFAKAWLGKVLGKLNVPTPYANDGNRKTVADIEPTADVSATIPLPTLIIDKSNGEEDDLPWTKRSHIEKIDWIREEVGGLQKKIVDLDLGSRDRELSIARTNVYNYLCESRFYLGFELGRLKDES